jgi:hypothetical protein
MLDITQEVLSSFGQANRTKRRPQPVTPFMVSKVFDLHTLYLVIRRDSRQSGENCPNSELMFCSNAFQTGMFEKIIVCIYIYIIFYIIINSVNSCTKRSKYNYESNKLQINSLSAVQNNDECILTVSYSVSYHYVCKLLFFIDRTLSLFEKIPAMYQCTLLLSKWLKITILNENNKDSGVRWIYQIRDDNDVIGNSVNRKLTAYLYEYM